MATAPLTTVSAGEMLTFFFLLLGPIKIVGPFAKLTRGAEPRLCRQLAVRGVLPAAGALAVATILGEKSLDNFRISVPVLAVTGGLILFLTALDTIMRQFRGPAGADAQDVPLSLSLAASPLAFPTIVTPAGIAAVIIFVTLSPDLAGKATIGLLLLVILLLDLVAMWYARAILKWLTLPLYILGGGARCYSGGSRPQEYPGEPQQDRGVHHDHLSPPAGDDDERLAPGVSPSDEEEK